MPHDQDGGRIRLGRGHIVHATSSPTSTSTSPGVTCHVLAVQELWQEQQQEAQGQ
jgi:hypothetical protein